MTPSTPALVYDCDVSRLGPYAPCFKPLKLDAQTEAWLAHYAARPHGALTGQISRLLSSFLSSYDVHGLLGSYAMHLLSAEAFADLLGPEQRGSLLDVGAGAGYVTENARSLFRHIECTESSGPLRRRLKQRGFLAHASDLSDSSLERTFDVVSCLNVLDRTARPLSLLDQLIAHMAKDGLLMLALPLPLSPHVHVAGGTVSPRERLPATPARWEEAVRDLTDRLLTPRNLTVRRIARVPYLSRGDQTTSVYTLDDAVWICERSSALRQA